MIRMVCSVDGILVLKIDINTPSVAASADYDVVSVILINAEIDVFTELVEGFF